MNSDEAHGVLYKRAEACPDAAQHTPHPGGYVAHAEWAQSMLQTHDQERCPTCGYWVIWRPKGRLA